MTEGPITSHRSASPGVAPAMTPAPHAVGDDTELSGESSPVRVQGESRERAPAAGSGDLQPRSQVGLVYAVLWCVAWAGFALFFRRRVAGAGSVPAGPALLVANHSSYLDIPLIGVSLRRHVCFVARDTLADSRLLAWIMRRCGAILIRRNSADRAALDAIVAHLRAGDCVVVFPEGRRSRDGSLQRWKGGAALAARRAGAPVVPVALFGTATAAPPGGRPHPGPTGVRFGDPLEPERDVLEKARDEVQRLLELGRP